jgi:hypothetical protein
MTVGSAGWRRSAKCIASTLAAVSVLANGGHLDGVVSGHLVACRLFMVSDARQVLADGSAVKAVPLPGVNACSYFISPESRKRHRGQAEAVGITLFINYRNAPTGKIPIEVDGHPARWLMASDDLGVLSFAVKSDAFVVTISGNRLPSKTSERIAERAAAIVLTHL